MKIKAWLFALATLVGFWFLVLVALVIFGGVTYATKTLWGALG